ncbi:MAG: CHAT domain-containing protein [Phycisphaerales bacterium]
MNDATTSPRGDGGGGGEPLDLEAFVALDAAVRDERLQSTGDPDAELRRLGDEAERAVSTDPAIALERLEMVGEAADRLGHPGAAARASRGRVLAMAYLGRLEAAAEFAASERESAEASGETIEAARLRLAAMQPLLKLGRVAEAIAEGEAAVRTFDDADRPDLAGRAEINLGNVRKAAGDALAALDHLGRARQALQDDATLVATIDNTRGEALLDLDRLGDARSAFEAAGSHFASAGHAFASAIVEGNLADLAGRSGHLAEAFERFASARAALGDRADGHAARLAMEEGEVFDAVGLHDVALERLREARTRFDAIGLAYESIRAALAEASALENLDRPGEASATLASLDEAIARVDHPGLRVRRDARLARLAAAAARRTGDVRDRAAAEAFGRRAFGDGDETDAVPGISEVDRLRVLLDRSRWHEDLGRPVEANASAEQAEALAGELGLGIAIAESGVRRAELARRRGDDDAAVESARRAVAEIERTRDALGAERLRAAFSGRRLGAYEQLVLSLLARGGESAAAEAFEVAELARSRTLLERIGRRAEIAGDGPGAGSEDAIDPSDPEIRGLLEKLQGLHARLSAEARDDQRSGLPVRVRRELAEAEAELERRLAARSAVGGSAARGRRSRVEGSEWRRRLADDEAIVEYFEASGRWIAFVATRDRIEALPLELATGEVHDALDRFAFRSRRRLRANGPTPGARSIAVDSILSHLGSRLWGPVAGRLDGRRRVTVVPHGVLHGVPFAALDVGEGPLVAHHHLSIAPSVAVWLSLREQAARREAPGRTVLVGVTDDAAPAVEDEIRGIAAAIDPTGGPVATSDSRPSMPAVRSAAAPEVLCGCEAGADAVLDRLADPGVGMVHLACHGRFLPEAPHASGLRLSDRWVSVRDLMALPRTPSVVVLSGCETGGLSVRRGEEVLGLARTLLATGTRSVIASLWPVSDRSTCELMVDFHRCWSTFEAGSTASVAAALAEAQRALGRSTGFEHPAHWASFFTIGHAS